jgi:glycosyltransferase involved in cell wall biosynthesis/SAM-dependent methyltransferase
MRKYVLHCSKAVAIDSADHLAPRGTANDNSRNPLFNRKIEALLNKPSLSVLDIGCAGGGFVKDLLDGGHDAVGLEGSDYSKKLRRAEWATIPDHLFTCDVTRDFSLTATDPSAGQESPASFDVITGWEFMEHIRSEDIAAVVENIRKHLAPGGLVIFSIADFPDEANGVSYHQTVRPRDWWETTFRSLGLQNQTQLAEYFDPDWVRGPMQGSISFHLVLTRQGDPVPPLPASPPLAARDLFETGREVLRQGIAGHNAGGFHGNVNYALTCFERGLQIEDNAGARADRATAQAYLRGGSQFSRPLAAAPGFSANRPRPKISVITPTFNCGPYLEKTIQSILAQEYDNLEHIVMDGGSKDETVDVLKKYPHIRWTSEPDRGEGHALNKALKLVTGDIVHWLNGDDWIEPGVYRRVAAEMNPQAGIHVVYGMTNMVNDALQFLWLKKSSPHMSLELLLRYWRNAQQVHQPSTFYSRQLVDDVGPFNDSLHFSIDLEYWLRIAIKYRFHYVDMIMSTMRNRSDSKSIDTVPKQIASHWRVLLPFHKYLNSQQRIAFWQEYYQYLLQVLGTDRQDPMPPVTQEALIGLAQFVAQANDPQKTEALVGYLAEQHASNPGSQELARHARESVGNPHFTFTTTPTASA